MCSSPREPDGRRLLVSVHDVMPGTLDEVRGILAFLADRDVSPVTLLVVPGAGWSVAELERLRSLQREGVHLAGHGWLHHVKSIRGWRHRLHSRVISRNVAEHLEHDDAGLVRLMARCHAWFGAHGLAAPDLYVPPAWAMGRIGRDRLDRLPFRHYELLAGVYDSRRRRLRTLPLVGFEADTRARQAFLAVWNRINAAASGRRRPLRVAIHPPDLGLPLRAQLERLLRAPATAIGYGELGA